MQENILDQRLTWTSSVEALSCFDPKAIGFHGCFRGAPEMSFLSRGFK